MKQVLFFYVVVWSIELNELFVFLLVLLLGSSIVLVGWSTNSPASPGPRIPAPQSISRRGTIGDYKRPIVPHNFRTREIRKIQRWNCFPARRYGVPANYYTFRKRKFRKWNKTLQNLKSNQFGSLLAIKCCELPVKCVFTHSLAAVGGVYTGITRRNLPFCALWPRLLPDAPQVHLHTHFSL